MTNKRRKQIEEVAVELLKDVGCYPSDITSELPIDVHRVVRAKNIGLVEYDFGEDVSGVLLYNGVEATIGFSSNNGLNRQRFTIAHELGHFILGHQRKGVFVDTPDKYFPPLFRNNESSTGESLQEQEANAFAASILMPETLLLDQIDLIQRQGQYLIEDYNIADVLARYFGVSAQAMTFRLNRLNTSW